MVHVYRLSTLLMCFSIIMLHVIGYDGLSQCFLLVWLINRKSMPFFCGQRASGNFHGFVLRGFNGISRDSM